MTLVLLGMYVASHRSLEETIKCLNRQSTRQGTAVLVAVSLDAVLGHGAGSNSRNAQTDARPPQQQTTDRALLDSNSVSNVSRAETPADLDTFLLQWVEEIAKSPKCGGT